MRQQNGKKAEINPFLLRKWTYAFSTFFDINGNGSLEWKDFDTLAQIICATRGSRSHEYISAKLAFPEIWYSLTQAAGIDEAGKLSLDDWIALWKENRNGKWTKVYLDYMYTLFDASGDRLVDQAEYVQVMQYFSIDRETANHAFDQFAVGKDGTLLMAIDWKQFNELWKEYFHSTEHTAKGNYLLGCP
ncbi:unnamed protein product, partial [Mesorhabditis belari]|uniref:EF-hand domain-containing protein n=1 Tax=Mesorhabditis belari TaxID=2138241 RepID=A0AAF3EUI4_9BILA